jgi:16S rRNA processing protein RimM
MGKVLAPFGVKGWVKVQTLTETPESLLRYPLWWVEADGNWRECQIEQAKVQTAGLIAKPAGCDDRDAAIRLKGQQVAIPRSAFPEVGANEYYWGDLLGLSVVNMQGENFGAVSEVFETGANDVLVVQGERERLIPFVAAIVREVDIAQRVIRVDWGADY